MIYLYGAGKRSSIVIDLLHQNKVRKKIILVDKKKFKNKQVFNEKYLLKNFNPKKDYLIITIANPLKKKEIYYRLKKYCNIRLFNPLISTTASIKKKVKIGKGTVVMDNAYIGEGVIIKENSAIGISSLVSHDCKIGNYCEISHRTKIAGNVKISDNVFIGLGAIVIQKIKINEKSFIGAGVLVKKDIPKNKRVTLRQEINLK